jgi:LEA14-like dessication related protein
VKRLVAALLLAGGLLAGGVVGGGCTFLGRVFEKPQVAFSRVAVDELSFSGLTARFIFTVENPNTVGIDLAKLDYSLVLDGRPFANGSTEAGLHVPPSKTGELTVPLTLSFGQMVDGLTAVFKRDSIAYAMKTQLSFATSVGPLVVPVESTGTLPVPHLPRFSIGQVELGQAGPTGTTLEVSLAIANPNDLEIPIGGLTWRISVEDTPIANGRLGALQLVPHRTAIAHLQASIDFVSVGLAVAAALSAHSARIVLDGSVELVPGQAWPLHLEEGHDPGS